MKTDRARIQEYLESFFVRILSDNEKLGNINNYCFKQYNYPETKISDILTKRVTLSEISDFECFILTDAISRELRTKNKLDTYFSDDEIENYSKIKYKQTKKVKFPLKFKMIRIATDQWIGKTTARELVSLRNGGIIRYNENIQRTMRRGIRGRTEEYRITENKKSVREIREAMTEGTFISNTITLNIPDDITSDYTYDENTMALVIKKANSLDIIDGFHRLIALEQATHLNTDWDYPMELRITNYSQSKGQRFVYQEDQKTKMKKIDSDSYNVEDDAVKTVSRLNEDPLFNLQGEIKRNGGLISLPEMAAIIKRIHFTGLNKNQSRVKSIELAKELRDSFNNLTEIDNRFLTQPYNFATLFIVLVAFDWFKNNNIEPTRQGKIINDALNNINEKLESRFKRKAISLKTAKEIALLLEEVS